METKFIGLEGFNEIESLPTKKRRVCRRELTTAQKTVRFVKRATTFCAKSVVRMSKNTAAKLAQAIENRKGSLKSVTIKSVNSPKKAKTQISAIDKAFNESRNGTTKSAGEIVSELSFKSGKQYAHLAPSAIRSQKLLRKKAVLAVVACFSAITLSCVTVASALDMKDNNSAQTPALVATSDEAVPNTEIDGESASANLKAISPSCASLYIDGKFIGARTPYGYLKAEDDCHQLIIDPVAAVVVQRMFRWASEGAGLNTIAVRLNEAGILTPSHYKKMQGKITHENLLGSGKWQTRTVGVILRSEVYTGDLVQGQTKTVDHRQVKADAEEWTVVRDTHEAIISREQFAAVQEILNQTASRAKAREVKAFTPNLLKGKVFCAHCGGSLHRQRNIRKKSDDVYFYHCLSQSRISKDACPGVTIREDALLDMLADMLQDSLDTALGQYTLSLAELPRQAADRAELREKITSRKQEIQRLRSIVRSLYENLVQGVLTKDEYFDYKEKYESRIADLAVEMEQLEDGLRTMDAQAEQHRALEQDAAQIKTDRALTGVLIERLIDRIEVSHDKQITVRYRFQSEFETYAEVLEQCRNM